jgi:vancomycin resistance protein YoaR
LQMLRTFDKNGDLLLNSLNRMKIKMKMLTQILKNLLNQLENSLKTAQYSSLKNSVLRK